jgi:hypothetical protein
LGAQCPVPLHQSPAAHSASAAQVVGHDALFPLHRYGVQAGLPDDATGRNVQVPTEPATLQASHAPPHVVSQHTPSTQNPLAHELPPLHAVPLTSLGTQWMPLQ